MNLEKQFSAIHPGVLFLNLNNKEKINAYLLQTGLLGESDFVQEIEKAGEGNMNSVLRIRTKSESFIVKQSRPWVEKYPQVAAPIERIYTEAEFIRVVANNKKLRSFTPDLIHFDHENYLMILEDLGEISDFSHAYQSNGNIALNELEDLLLYLSLLHSVPSLGFPSNADMKKLNHQHIFILPFTADNGFDLDLIQNGLSELSGLVLTNRFLKIAVKELGDRYLEKGDTLIHGDFYPGSWLKVKDHLKVIDAEFSFTGFAEFDWSVMLAHMHLAQQDEKIIDHILAHFRDANNLDLRAIFAYAGVEILRRFYGLAQLPLCLDLDEKHALTLQAIDWILN